MRDMKPSEQTIKDAVGKMSSTFDSDQRILACASMLNSESVEEVNVNAADRLVTNKSVEKRLLRRMKKGRAPGVDEFT